MKQSRILLTGASGMLAAEVVPALRREGHTVAATSRTPRGDDAIRLDITDEASIRKAAVSVRPDIVFHLAAETDVDLCQKDPDHAFRVNALGTETIALLCRRLDIPMVYISTSAVFRGDRSEPYTEYDGTAPVNVYGQSKLAGEKAVERLLSRYLIVRPGWMIGGQEIDKKFVYKIVTQIQEGRENLKAVNDKKGSPTFTTDFARGLLAILKSRRWGVWHLANRGWCSRFDIAVRIVELLELQDRVSVDAVGSAAFPLPAPRPDSEMIRNYKLDLLGENTMPPWEESLAGYVRGFSLPVCR